MLYDPLSFKSGQQMKNRFMLAPLTNLQSHDDGTLSSDEFDWLTMRARGGFGITMTCAAYVQDIGKGFPGQLGIAHDSHIAGLTRLADAINKADSLSIVQLHHAGMRSLPDVIGETPICPSDNEETGARAMSLDEVKALRDDFIAAAQRAEKAGFGGIEIHGAHGYVLGQFISGEINQRDDNYGGSLENRTRIVDEIIDGIRASCRPNFCLGIRLSPERFGMTMDDAIAYYDRLCGSGKVDFIDMSLWDINKQPEEEGFADRSLIEIFSARPRGDTRLTVAGKINSPNDVKAAMQAGVDFVTLGRAAILHHNYPELMRNDDAFQPATLPVSRDYLKQQGLGKKFVDYMATWDGFVA
jgi:2,4-dienoyl-CoA reductase-like NADH-dependent reductase (Old Yellow Enzyme family)